MVANAFSPVQETHSKHLLINPPTHFSRHIRIPKQVRHGEQDFLLKSVLQFFIYENLTDLNFFFQKSTASWSQNPDFCCAQSMSPLGVQLYIQDRHVNQFD